MASDAELRRIALSYRNLSAASRSRLLTLVAAAWDRLGDYRDDDIEAFAARVAPIVTGTQLRIAGLTDAFLAAYEAAALEQPARPVGVPREVVENPRGVSALEVYRRTGPTVWTALSNGDPLSLAVGKARERALNMAATDLQLAKTRASRHVLKQKDNVVGYRRILEGPASCGLCVVASTQRYHSGELMPIHGGCDCGVQPIYGDRDPGQVVDPETLDGVHERIAERFGRYEAGAGRISRSGPEEYRDVLVTHEHGEMGPVLGVRGQDFTGPSDI